MQAYAFHHRILWSIIHYNHPVFCEEVVEVVTGPSSTEWISTAPGGMCPTYTLNYMENPYNRRNIGLLRCKTRITMTRKRQQYANQAINRTLVAETLRCILPPSKHIPCDNPSPFRRKPFRLKLGRDGRLDAHPYGIFHVVEKDLNQSHRPAQN